MIIFSVWLTFQNNQHYDSFIFALFLNLNDMENFISKLHQEEVTANICGYSYYGYIKLLEFFKLDYYAYMCWLAMRLGLCDDVFNF